MAPQAGGLHPLHGVFESPAAAVSNAASVHNPARTNEVFMTVIHALNESQA
jgi:hypothetical protein